MQQAVDEAARKARRDSDHWMRQCHRHADRAAAADAKREEGK
ncbi:hypothetical protein V473_07125 [Sphingobium cupriresistens LL01]|uniref:Uncharacterized protein n=1 Tax=Sphingobium cupriresistens LL01 TaxID=1420583 RepID=A0A0J7Y5V3_9SPHN|nr:hypothetical protein V473_07125 [Sphingobium cupriresistens LL01]